MLQNLTADEEAASISKINMLEEQENNKYSKQREKLLRETAVAKQKIFSYSYATMAQHDNLEAMRLMEEEQTKYEMNKKLWEEREKTEILKRETEKLKFSTTKKT
jgi:hypothetical protein